MLKASTGDKRDWIRRAVEEHCGYRITDKWISPSGETFYLECARGIYWSKLLRVIQQSCSLEESSRIIELFEKADGREHSQIAMLVYGVLRRHAKQHGYITLDDGLYFHTIYAPEPVKRAKKKAKSLVMEKHDIPT